VGAMNYYVPAYVALVAASVGLISLPTHMASNRELGVLKRYRASSMPAWVVVGAQIAVTFLISMVSAAILVSVALPVYDVPGPDSVLLVIAGFALVALVFSALGVLLGAVLPSSRAAQALGVMLWFLMLMVGGAGPPPEVLTGAMGVVGDGHRGRPDPASPRDPSIARWMAEPGPWQRMADHRRTDHSLRGSRGVLLPLGVARPVGVDDHLSLRMYRAQVAWPL